MLKSLIFWGDCQANVIAKEGGGPLRLHGPKEKAGTEYMSAKCM